MPSSSYAVDDEVVQSLELPEFLISNMVHVSAVGDVSEPESKDRQLVVHASDRDYPDRPDRLVLSSH